MTVIFGPQILARSSYAVDAHMQGVPNVMLKMNAPASDIKTNVRTLKIEEKLNGHAAQG